MIQLQAIGTVKSQKQRNSPHFPFYSPAQIVIEPEYAAALKNLELNSHIWVICLYDPKDKEKLQVKPKHVDESLGLFGTLALRTPNHPNPLGLTLTRLLRVEGNVVEVDRLDAFDGTPVLDIKPYYEFDIVPSPTMPIIRQQDRTERQNTLIELAESYHGELCAGAALAIRMILLLETDGVDILSPELSLAVCGSPCLADTLQGLCRARLANPPRFRYREAAVTECCWTDGRRRWQVTVKQPLPTDPQHILQADPEELFQMEVRDETAGN